MRFLALTIVCLLLSFVLIRAGAADDAAARARLDRTQALRKERPGDGLLVFYEAIVRLSVGEREATFDLLRSLKGRKLGLIPVRDTGFDAVWDDAAFQRIRQDLADEEQSTPAGPVAFRLKDPKLIPEGIAYDAKGERFFVSSVAQHKIIVTDGKGEERDFSNASDKLDAILGLSVDATRGRLYAVSTNGFEESAQKERRNTVLCYDLKSSRLVERIVAPEASQLNDVAFAGDGTIYATDSNGGTLFRKKSGETTLTPFGKTGALRGANGIAVGSEESLYVAVSTGIMRIERTTGEPRLLPQPDTMATGGIDGLYWFEGDLIGVQNVTNPGRVIRISLGDSGNRIAGLKVLQSHHHPELDEPTTGAIAKEALYLIGNSYVGHYQPDGTIRDAPGLKGTAVIAVPLQQR